ncbi:MAG: histidine phosphatase family protein [Rhodobacterales bacterium]|nr:MAG: histidine phosphatase family protein [Rhodobacterales bacterium]
MREIFWVRHGPTHRKDIVGWTDVPADLSDTAALARLAAYLPDAPVISSDLIRAVATADAIAQNRPRLPHDPALREIYFGDWETRTHTDLSAEFPELMRVYWDDPETHFPPGGERWSEMVARVTETVTRLSAQHERLIVVAHMGVIVGQIQRALNLPLRDALAQKIDNLSVTRTVFTPGKGQADPINFRP